MSSYAWQVLYIAVSALAQQEQKPAADDAAAIAKETGKSHRGANQFAISE